MSSIRIVIVIVTTIFFVLPSSGKIKFGLTLKNVECIANENWLNGTECYLKLLPNRTVLLHGKTFLHRTAKSIKVRFQFFRWLNGFRPYLADFITDWCYKMNHKDRMNPIEVPLYTIINMYSNMNHTCPYAGEIIVPGVAPDIRIFPSFIESGIYRMSCTVREMNEVIFTVHFKVEVVSPF